MPAGHVPLRVAHLQVYGFRGIETVSVDFTDHTALIGPNGSGKTTIVDALSLLFGRDRFVRQLTEQDFFGGDPNEAARIRLVGTIEFATAEPDDCLGWFQDGRAVPKWRRPDSPSLKTEPVEGGASLVAEPVEGGKVCAQVAYAARFDHETLTVEALRYFHDDDDLFDPFVGGSPTPVPAALLAEVGLLIVPSVRTRDRVLSFSGDTFRRLVASTSGLPAEVLLDERNRLRAPSPALEEARQLKDIVARLEAELGRLLARKPKFQLRESGTNAESLLQSLAAHFEFEDGISLPVGQHGTGLVSLQTILLLLELSRSRRSRGKSVVLVIEEPELHLPPGLQRRVVHQAMSACDQTITTTHSPRVAALFQAESTMVLARGLGALRATPLLASPLRQDSPNGLRKLFLEGRQQTIEALMQPWVLIPEGRSDFEWLRLLSDITETASDLWTAEEVPFGAIVGVVPTHDASVKLTCESLLTVREGIACLVDGDGAGNAYVDGLFALKAPPDAVVQWPNGSTIEDVIGWIADGSWAVLASRLQADLGISADTPAALVKRLKAERNDCGLKGDYLVYESMAWLLREVRPCAARAVEVLRALRDAVASGVETAHIKREKHGKSGRELFRVVL